MSYHTSAAITLGSSKTSLTLKAQLVNSSGEDYGSEITTGFSEIGGGNYLWCGYIPDGFIGGIKFLDSSDNLMAFTSISPTETENVLNRLSLDNIEIDGVNLRQAISLMAAALVGVLRQPNGDHVSIKALGDSTTERIAATVNSNGERLSVTIHPPN